jgi:hypothetical protein
MWEGPEATSVWVEITERQKTEVKDDFERNNVCDMASLAAAQQMIITRQSWHEENLFLFGKVSRAALPAMLGESS